jgi:zinc protease
MRRQVSAKWAAWGGLVALAAATLVACASTEFSPQPPDLRGAPKLWVPSFSTARLSNGITLHVNTDPYLPMVSVAVGIRGGFLMDPPDKAGLAQFFVRNLMARTERLDRKQLAQTMDVIGARIGGGVLGDGIVMSTDVLEDRATGALKLLAEILIRPGFDAGEMERIRLEQRSNLDDGLGNPGTAAMWGIRQVVFGTGHPMGLPEVGTKSSIHGFTLDDLKARAHQVLRPDQIVIVMAGRVEPALAQQAAQAVFGGWAAPAGPPAALAKPAGPGPEPEDRQLVHYIPQAGASQTTIVVARRGLPIGDPNYEFLRMVSGRAPRGASAWLRGVEQVTYGVGGIFEANSQAGFFGARLSVDAPATGMALKSLLGRYGARLGGSIDIEKVLLLTGEGQPFYTLRGRTASVARQHILGLPLDHFAQLRQRIDDVREAEVEIKTQDLIDDDLMEVVLVGDEAAIREQVPATGLGTLTRLILSAGR